MEHQKILNLLKEADNSSFVTRKWNIFNDQSNENYSVRNEIIYSTEVLKSNFCDYNDAYISVRSDIFIIRRNNANPVKFNNRGVFTKCITNIDGTTIHDAENLDLVMPMYNLLE